MCLHLYHTHAFRDYVYDFENNPAQLSKLLKKLVANSCNDVILEGFCIYVATHWRLQAASISTPLDAACVHQLIIHTLRLKPNGRHFANDIPSTIFQWT